MLDLEIKRKVGSTINILNFCLTSVDLTLKVWKVVADPDQAKEKPRVRYTFRASIPMLPQKITNFAMNTYF